MAKFVAAFVLLTMTLSWSTSTRADAAPAETPSAKLHLTPKKVVVGGLTYIQLPADQMGRVELRLEAADKLEGVASAQDKLIDQQTKIQARTSSLAKDYAGLAKEEKARADAYQKTLEELSSSAHSPLLWLGIGAGAAILSVIIYGAVHNSSPTINVQR